MGRGTKHRGDAQAAILDAAEDLIRSRGVQGTSIKDIVRASATSTGAIYHHFSSKHGVILAVARRAIAEPLKSVVAEPGIGVSPADLFDLAVRRIARDELTAQLMLQLWAGAATDPRLREVLNSELVGVHDVVTAHLAQWSARAGLVGGGHAVAEIIVGLTMGYVAQRSLIIDFDEAEYVEYGKALLSLLPASAANRS